MANLDICIERVMVRLILSVLMMALKFMFMMSLMDVSRINMGICGMYMAIRFFVFDEQSLKCESYEN